MKTLLALAVLIGSFSSQAWAGTDIIDIPADEAAMAHAPANSLSRLNFETGDTAARKQQENCQALVTRAKAILENGERRDSSISEYGRQILRGIMLAPVRDVFVLVGIKGEFISKNCGTSAAFDSALNRRTVAVAPVSQSLEATSGGGSRNAIHSGKTIHPVAQGADGLRSFVEPSAFQNASR